MMKSYARFLAVALCLTALGACSSDEDQEKAEKYKADKEAAAEIAAVKATKTTPICPQVAIVRDLDTVTSYADGTTHADQLIDGAKMQSVEGQCSYHAEESKDADAKAKAKDGIDITFDLNFIAARGPKLDGKHAEFPYFVAVVDPTGNVLQKNPMTVPFGFSSDSTTTQSAESLHVFIPLAKDKQDAGPSYQVLMGFQLTQEQLAQVKKSPAP